VQQLYKHNSGFWSFLKVALCFLFYSQAPISVYLSRYCVYTHRCSTFEKNEMQKLTIIIFLLIYNLNFGQEKVYNLISKTENSDINYKAFEKFDDFKIYENDGLKKAFEPIKGDFNVYFFIAEFKGDSFDGTRKTFHDYLILKVDPKTELIVDGFQYSLEWAEPPAISDLYKVTDKNQKINNGIYLNSLKMELVEQEYISEWRKELKDNGIIKLK